MSQHSPFNIAYGDFERLIAGLIGATPASVRTRFRKLRLQPFPDDIQSGTGVRVEYNLRRVLAIATVFQLNNLYVAQGYAASIVKSAWPEICRAFICAANDCGIISKVEDISSSAGPILEIGCGSIRATAAPHIDVAAVRDISVVRLAIRPSIALDLNQLLQALIVWAETQGGDALTKLVVEIHALKEDFGWRYVSMSSANPPAIQTGSSFLEVGPYFDRALMFLEADEGSFDAKIDPPGLQRLQSLYDYLESPAPVDAPKAKIGLPEASTDLGSYLQYYARKMGLNTREEAPTSWGLDEPRGPALHLVRLAMKQFQ